jgi:hypothetical protein
LGVIAIPIIHTRKAIPLNSKQKKRIGFDGVLIMLAAVVS